uniref:RGS domain-containing protein n=1 Tax=Ficedula albicollis TaxID=59894 RepID=A0A803VGD1_FICAL
MFSRQQKQLLLLSFANVPSFFHRPTPEEALKWGDSLEKLLLHKYGLAAFRAFLRTEFSEENLEFWLACEEFKKIKSQSKMVSKAKKIFSEYIAIQSCKEVRAAPTLVCGSRRRGRLGSCSPALVPLPTGQPGLLHTGAHQGEPAEHHPQLLRPGPEEDLWAHGEGLVPPLPPLRPLLGHNQPEERQLPAVGPRTVSGQAGSCVFTWNWAVEAFLGAACAPRPYGHGAAGGTELGAEGTLSRAGWYCCSSCPTIAGTMPSAWI